MKKLCIIGTGYVGLPTAVCFADLGNDVTCIEIDQHKLNLLRAGKSPIYEPGLEEVLRRNLQAERVHFTDNYADGLRDADAAFICVGTPMGDDGTADLQYIKAAAVSIGKAIHKPTIIIDKSTVPVGTGDMVATLIREHAGDVPFAVVSNPEFLREGSAINDFFRPDRVVLGATNRHAAEQVAALYEPLDAPIIITDLRTAEMIKYASNAFLATRISFINEIAAICEQLGADVKEVARGMGMDKRIGPHFLDAGIGYGGSCFPKDVLALHHMAAQAGCHPQLLEAVMEINRDARHAFVAKLDTVLGDLDGKRIGVMGLSFKPNTDDMRDAPSIPIIAALLERGASVCAYDPMAMPNAEAIMPEVVYCATPYDVAKRADALLIVTEWNEFKQLDFAKLKQLMRQPVILDGRNVHDPKLMAERGFVYRGVGRGVPLGEATGSAARPEHVHMVHP
jgi:UDPglucose 6-dehydrogenase